MNVLDREVRDRPFRVFICENPACRWNNKRRKVYMQRAGLGMYTISAVYCVCDPFTEMRMVPVTDADLRIR